MAFEFLKGQRTPSEASLASLGTSPNSFGRSPFLAHPLRTDSCQNLVGANSPEAASRRRRASGSRTQPHAIARDLYSHEGEPSQTDENHAARLVVVCEPLGVNNLMGALHPHGALYEKPVNIEKAAEQHAAFRNAIRDTGAVCVTVKDVLEYGCDRSERARLDLERLAMRSLRYELDPDTDPRTLSETERHFVSEDYKVEAVEAMSTQQLVDVIFSRPTVDIRRSFRDTGFTARYRFEPLTNVLFTRDQQIVTGKGVVMARMRSDQRVHEVELMQFVWGKLGIVPVGQIVAPGYLEGGDFIAAGDVALIGVGLRSNEEAVRQLCEQDLLGHRRVAVVKDNFEQHQDRMHLDCICSLLSANCVLLAEDVIGESCPKRRLVDEYELVEDELDGDEGWGRYRCVKSNVELGAYFEHHGYNVIPVPREEQLKYACNCLNLGGGSPVLSCHHLSAKRLAKDSRFDGDVRFVAFEEVTAMYGSLHCCSQVLR